MCADTKKVVPNEIMCTDTKKSCFERNQKQRSEIKATCDFKKTMKKWNNLLDKVKELENIEDIAKTLRLNIQIFNPLKKTDHIKEYNFNLKNHNETVQLLQV